MRDISAAGLAALDASRLKQGHLIALELPETTLYLTDYMRDVVYGGVTYVSGSIKQLSNYTQSRSLTTQNITLTITGLDEQHRALFFLSSQSFLGKKARIYRAFFDADGNVIPFTNTTGEPFVYYRGKVASATLDDSSPIGGVGSSSIKYTISNDFYDIESVQGRFTSDAAHRALVTVNGQLVPSGAAKRPEYQDDLGFIYADNSVTVLAKYQTQEVRYKMSSKRAGGLGGLMGMKNTKLTEYYETVDREVNLNFNLTAKYLPVVYGCQKVPGIPIFCDTENNNPNSLWIIYAVCEGEVEGFTDIFIDDKPLICYDDADDVDRVCFGRRKNIGDTIQKIASGGASTGPSVHGQEYVYESPDGNISFWTYHGLANQTAADRIVQIAANGGFYLQNLKGAGPEYWSSSMKLLDTAYVVANVRITSGRTSIPSFDFEVMGRKVKIYNSDGSIASSNKTTLNLSWQIFDYMTSLFGPRIPLDALSIPSFIEAAAAYNTIDTSYETSWCPYWRFLGWENQSSSNRKIIQTNVLLDTANTVFKNVQNMLAHGDAALCSFSGKYYISVEKDAVPIVTIPGKDILGGDISISDNSGRDRFNAIQASIIDPGKGWKASPVTFYNSNYLTEDNGVEKKMNVVFDYITNYYTARSIAERNLKRSRFQRTYSITLPYKYMGLLPNDVVELDHPSIPITANRTFVIDSIESTTNGKFNVTLQETNSDVFITSSQTDASSDQIPSVSNIVLPPRDLSYTPYVGSGTLLKNGTLSWKGSLSPGVVSYQVYHTNRLEAYSITVTPEQTSGSTYSLDLFELPSGLYTFEVRAVDITGFRSKPVSLSITLNSAKNLSNVTGFIIENASTNSSLQFSGNYMSLKWDATPDLAIYPTLKYNIQIMTSTNVLLQDLLISNSTSYSYSYAQMLSDYSNANGGAPGIYRDYKVRIKVVGDAGQESVSWVYVNEGT